MTNDDWSSLPVRESTRDRFKEERPEDASSADEFLNTLLDQYTDETEGVDANEIARQVTKRLQGSKPLAEMAFEDWFQPDYARTIADHIESELMMSDDYAGIVAELVAKEVGGSGGMSYEDVVSASEAGARAALDDYQR